MSTRTTTPTDQYKPPRDMQEVEDYNHQGGGYWFSTDTKRYFGSRVCGILRGGKYFVSSERMDMNHPRLYTIREVLYRSYQRPDGWTVHACDIGTVGEFQAYASARAADRAITRLLDQG